MRVWIVNPYDNLPLEGYRPQRFWLMARAFAQAGCETTLWTSSFSHANKSVRKAVSEGVCDGFQLRLVMALGYRANIGIGRIVDHWVVARRWRRMAEEATRPDLIIASSPPLGLVAAARQFAQEKSVPYIVDVMDAWPETFERVVPRFVLKALGLFRAARANYLGAAGISTVADRYVDLVRGYGYQGPVRKFLHGIEMDRHGEHKEHGENSICSTCSTWLRLVYVGNMSLSYDLETLIRAVQEMSGVALDLAGTGPDRGRLEREVTKVGGGGERIRFHGYLGEKELNALLAESDAGVIPMFPASCVGVPYKLADYARAGLRIIESLGGETGEIVQRFKAGVHYDAGSIDSLKAAIEKVASSKSIVTSGEFAAFFDADKIYREYVQWVGSLV